MITSVRNLSLGKNVDIIVNELAAEIMTFGYFHWKTRLFDFVKWIENVPDVQI
jgi:hypothetical protein